MEKGINTVVNETKMNVVGMLQSSQLPISVAILILESVTQQLRQEEQFVLDQETKIYQEGSKKEE